MSDRIENVADGDAEGGDDVAEMDEAQEEALLKSDDDDPMNSNDATNAVEDGGNDDCEDDDDSDDGEDEEERLIKDYIETLGQIDQNKYGYENYVQLIEIAHKLSDLEKIRQSYGLFSAVYPVAPELWLKYLRIENSLASSEKEVIECEKLFRKALNDYFCPNIALEFASFASKSPDADKIWSELLAVYALHPMYGRKIVELWKDYIFSRQDSPDIQKLIQNTYEKLLRIPMHDMEETYIEAKVFVEKMQPTCPTISWEQIDKKYNRAKSHLQKLLPFESKLSTLDAKFHQNRATLYKEYIREADRFADEDVLQILYERMVTECCLNPACWLDYIEYLEKRDKYSRPEDLEDFPTYNQTAMDVINRALRNCTWSEKIFIRKLRLGEKLGYGKSEVKEIFEQGLEAGFQTPEPLVALWLEYLSYLARNTNFDDEKEKELLRANFDFAWTSLGKQWGVLADCNCEILQLWGKLEYSQLKDPPKGKELWTTVMESSDNPLKSALWMEFIHLEITKGADAGRKLYRKALSTQNIQDPYTIASSWLRFERCHGTLEQIATCQEQCDNILQQYEYQKQLADRQKQKMHEKGGNRNDQDMKTAKKRKSGGQDGAVEGATTKKSKGDVDMPKKMKDKKSDQASVSGRSDMSDIDPAKDSVRVFLSNLDYNVTEDEIIGCFPEIQITRIHLLKGASGKGRGFGYAELSSESEVQKALGFDRRKLNGRPVYISTVLREKEQRQKFKFSDNLEPQKLFVKGVPYDATEDSLKDLFKPFGEVKDVRIVYHKSGKPKGIAYIEYADAASASLAVMKLDQTEIQGLKLNVAISAPPPKPTTKDVPDIKKLLNSMGVKPIVNRGEQKPRLSFIPASVRRNVLQTAVLPSNGSADPPAKPKSNDDFRKLLNSKNN